MDYHLSFILGKIPNVFMERRVVNGKEQNVVCIPCEDAPVLFTKWKEPFLKFMMKELPTPEADSTSHRLMLLYRTKEDFVKAKAAGYRKRSDDIGKALPWIYDPSRAIDYTNKKATDVFIRGAICLDDISSEDVVLSPHTGQKNVKCVFKTVGANGTPIFCVGTICITDIDEEDIVMNPRTGRKNVPCVFHKLKMSDPHLNTHVICVTKKDGSEVEIGRFREYKEATETAKRIATATQQLNPQPAQDDFMNRPNPNENPKPLKIDGYTF